MDSMTQAALGAVIGGTVLGRRLGRKAILLGAVVGTLPDLDVVIDYGDAVANVTQHRGFSHSLFVLAGFGTLLAFFSTRLFSAREIPLSRWLLFFLLILLTHPLLDALTTYGTQLFWPMASPPVAWPIVFIIDPLYTLPLLIALIGALIGQKVAYRCAWGLALSCAYLLFAMGAKATVEHRLEPVLAAQGLANAPRMVQPAPFTTLLWRATVIDGDRHYESLISVFDQDPPQLEVLTRNTNLQAEVENDARVQRLQWFAGDFLRYDSTTANQREVLQITDLRLGFPGVHPFIYQLASRSLGESTWIADDVSQQLNVEREVTRETLKRLALRALGNQDALCATALVEERWRASPLGC